MKYFDLKTYPTYAALKAQYHALAQKHHPDYGGDVGVMQEINSEYQEALEALSGSLLPAVVVPPPTPKEKPPKAPKVKKPRSTPAQKKRAPAKQKASPKRRKTIVDILADVAIFGVEQLRERLRER